MKPVLISLMDSTNSIITFCSVFESNESKYEINLNPKSAEKVKLFFDKVIQNGHLYNRFCAYQKKINKKFSVSATSVNISHLTRTEFQFNRLRTKPVHAEVCSIFDRRSDI